MIRRVAFAKAAIAGAAGAVAWEALARAAIAAGLPIFDLVHLLGTMVLGDAPAFAWWTAGILLHASVGIIWAIFYAYFFWSVYDWRPPLQGLAFSVTLLQFILRRPLATGLPAFGILAAHLLFGLVFGITFPWLHYLVRAKLSPQSSPGSPAG